MSVYPRKSQSSLLHMESDAGNQCPLHSVVCKNRSTDNILKNKALPLLATLSSPKVLWEVISSTEKISDPQQLQYP